MKTVNIPHRWRSEPVYLTEVTHDDPQPMRTVLERATMAGRPPDQLRELRDTTVESIEIVDDETERQQLQWRIESIDREIAAPSPRVDLTSTVLTRTDLTRAVLTRAVLIGTDLTRAVLTRAVLIGTDLTGADLIGTDLTGTDLTSAVLTRAVLIGTDLTGAVLNDARQNFRAVLDAAPLEVSGLLLAIREGRINGSQYEGPCSCLKGTIGTLRGCRYDDLGDAPALQPNSFSPAERLFMAIAPGHIPAINPVAKIVEGWILEWQAQRTATEAR